MALKKNNRSQNETIYKIYLWLPCFYFAAGTDNFSKTFFSFAGVFEKLKEAKDKLPQEEKLYFENFPVAKYFEYPMPSPNTVFDWASTSVANAGFKIAKRPERENDKEPTYEKFLEAEIDNYAEVAEKHGWISFTFSVAYKSGISYDSNKNKLEDLFNLKRTFTEARTLKPLSASIRAEMNNVACAKLKDKLTPEVNKIKEDPTVSNEKKNFVLFVCGGLGNLPLQERKAKLDEKVRGIKDTKDLVIFVKLAKGFLVFAALPFEFIVTLL